MPNQRTKLDDIQDNGRKGGAIRRSRRIEKFEEKIASYVVSSVASFVSCESSCVTGRGIVGQVEK